MSLTSYRAAPPRDRILSLISQLLTALLIFDHQTVRKDRVSFRVSLAVFVRFVTRSTLLVASGIGE